MVQHSKAKPMTQQAVDKAMELVEKFEPMCLKYEGAAKQCAIICNQQGIDQLNRFADYWNLKNGEWYKDELIKLEQVKKAINQL